MPLPSEDSMEVETGSTASSYTRGISPSTILKPNTLKTDPGEGGDSIMASSSLPAIERRLDSTLESLDTASSCSRQSSPDCYRGDATVTDAMLKEEERLRAEEREDEESDDWKRAQELARMRESQRYDRLQHLLEKSSIYSKLLLNKMETQLEENKKSQSKKKKVETTKKKVETTSEVKKEGDLRPRTRKRKMDFETDYLLSDYMDDSGQLKKRRTNKQVTDKQIDHSSLSQEEEEESRYYDGQLIPVNQPKLVTGGLLRPYQLEGVEWLKVLYENGINGILADEMGLGKTIQCIAFIAYLLEMGVKGPFLVVAPLSTISNWVAEFKKFTPTISVYLYHGSISDRQTLRRKIFRSDKKARLSSTPLPVVVTSYEICLKDQLQLANRSWKFLIVDEGHRIKNLNCKLIKALKTYDAANRLLLTGTPLQNNLAELWSLLNFLIPDVFDDLNSFQSWFDFSSVVEETTDAAANQHIITREKEEHVLDTLHQILTPFLLRRLKTDVELNIPPKREILVYAPLTSVQEKYYTCILNRTIDALMKKQPTERAPSPVDVLQENNSLTRHSTRITKERFKLFDDNQFEGILSGEINPESLQLEDSENLIKSYAPTSVFNVRMTCVWVMLRKCCNHPYLVEFPLTRDGEPRIDRDLIKASGKLLLLERMLPALLKRKHKILIFSQMTQMLDILADYMDLSSFDFARLDGSMSYTNREAEMSRFREDSNCNIFLLSTRAGGLGINLTAADTVIIFDSDWNPQADLQAQDRCHRIGQTRPVMVYRFVTANTIDQRIVERAGGKRRLEKMVIHKGKFKGNTSNGTLSIDDLTDLLQSVDHEKIVKSNEIIISDAALEALLDRSCLVPNTESVTSAEKTDSLVKHEDFFRVLEEECDKDFFVGAASCDTDTDAKGVENVTPPSGSQED